MDKQFIIDEIHRTAENGQALGVKRFETATGIKQHHWQGKYWARWSDAINEAGYQSNNWQAALDDSFILKHLLFLTRKLQKCPTRPEIGLERRNNPDFPLYKSIRNRWNKNELVSKLLEYCQTHEGFSDVEEILAKTVVPGNKKSPDEEIESTDSGYVYLVKAQSAYKIGSTRAPYRRVAEIANQSANGAELLNLIATDDPEGIEKYWHRRFDEKRISGLNKQSGEWFSLSSDDIRAFKRRKTM